MSENFSYPLATVGGLIVAPDGDILVVKSKKWIDCYALPGGKIELGETREQAFIREIKEETNLSVENVIYVMAQDSIFSPQFWKPNHFIMHDFVAQLASGCTKNDVILNDEADNYLWKGAQELKQMPLNKEAYVLLDWYIRNGKHK
jgi:8-oxo-dGTP diphosphatase